jgi:hypothetical protein
MKSKSGGEGWVEFLVLLGNRIRVQHLDYKYTTSLASFQIKGVSRKLGGFWIVNEKEQESAFAPLFTYLRKQPTPAQE